VPPLALELAGLGKNQKKSQKNTKKNTKRSGKIRKKQNTNIQYRLNPTV